MKMKKIAAALGGRAVMEQVAEQIGTLAAPEIEAARLQICGACNNNKGGICDLCGCKVAVKARYTELKTTLFGKEIAYQVKCDGGYWENA